MRLPTDGFLLGCTARPLLMVWEVQAGERTAGGVTDDQAAAETAMFDALRTHPTGRGRIRYARLSFIGIGYVYGPTLSPRTDERRHDDRRRKRRRCRRRLGRHPMSGHGGVARAWGAAVPDGGPPGARPARGCSQGLFAFA
ncbi:hypothetical protein C1I98_10635 [Spongiactinospora gelatinilytica]|uniref:Uncharacterized protein n=1 Tax=Spongiactinospora gelatinilytica TaxID=2666298 RepID=A0A2W2HJ17_9ACTN|nr:hypothetical protein [Spongiactinospora gelatinilytica]PZG50390.1 hypothetical protein C1I98_10635 [Spongiactinospora gelatinilytica]